MKADAELDKKMAGFDFSTAKKACDVPAIQKLRQAHRQSLQAKNQKFDDDVIAKLDTLNG